MILSRRKTLASIAAWAASTAACGIRASAATPPDSGSDPVLDQGGPDALLYGRDQGYPVPEKSLAIRMGNPWAPLYRVGAFSHLDAIYATREVTRSPTPWLFKRTAADVRYRFQGQIASWTDYLARNPVLGLLVAKDDCILFEHYQYARTDADRLLAQSMTKSLMGVLVGLAIADGAIRSVDDTAEMYVPGFKDSEYGRTRIRDLLHMSSGVDFGEERDGSRDLNRLWRDMVLGAGFFKKGTVNSIRQFDHRIAASGSRFHYASIEPDVLGTVLHHVLGQPISGYLQDRLWHPIGAEANATWLLDAEGIEVGHFGFSAVLRDYARLGRLLAMDGAWGSQQVVPAAWLRGATSIRDADGYLAPGHATPAMGYGYLLWLLPGKRRQFALVGQNGQRICIDTASKLVMVHTALEDKHETWRLWSAIVDQLA
jgi:CubicO group peptidase (beta-lactamase class C family)